MNHIDKAAVTAIKCYKKFISPFKGFKCAYAVNHGISCSTVANNLIKEHGVIAARPLIKQQFTDCRSEFEKIKNDKGSSSCSSNYNNNSLCDVCHVPMGCSGPNKLSNCDFDIGSCDL